MAVLGRHTKHWGDVTTNNMVVDGPAETGGSLALVGDVPYYTAYESDAPTDEKYWQIISGAGNYLVRTLDDSGVVGEIGIGIVRDGNTIDWVSITNGYLFIEDGQIAFPPVANVTTSANFFDDYEEGEWDPVIRDQPGNNATMSVQDCYYQKVANVVHINGRATISSKGSIGAGNTVWMIGLPFQVSSDTNTFGSITISFCEGAVITAGMSITGYPATASSTIVFRLWDTTGGVSVLLGAEIGAAFDIIFSGVYRTDL